MLNGLKARLDKSIDSIRRLMSRPDAAAADLSRDAMQKQARRQERLRIRQMRRELFQLLERHQGSRRLMRHLALVERTFFVKGFAEVEALPLKVIVRALDQLEGLVQDWSSDGLAELRSRLAMLVKNCSPELELRRAQGADAAAGATPANADEGIDGFSTLAHGLSTYQLEDVGDDFQAAFDEMERSWAGRVPAAVNTAESRAA